MNKMEENISLQHRPVYIYDRRTMEKIQYPAIKNMETLKKSLQDYEDRLINNQLEFPPGRKRVDFNKMNIRDIERYIKESPFHLTYKAPLDVPFKEIDNRQNSPLFVNDIRGFLNDLKSHEKTNRKALSLFKPLSSYLDNKSIDQQHRENILSEYVFTHKNNLLNGEYFFYKHKDSDNYIYINSEGTDFNGHLLSSDHKTQQAINNSSKKSLSNNINQESVGASKPIVGRPMGKRLPNMFDREL